MPDKKNFIAELDLRFVQSSQFKHDESNIPSEYTFIARNVLRLLMMGWDISWKNIITPKVLHAVFVKRNTELLRAFRFEFQQGFLALYEQLKNQHLSADQQEQVQLYLSNCLALLPYSNLTPYESIKIPQYINEHWALIEYMITPIELTHYTGLEKYITRDRDRVFAYGLSPISKGAQAHLIFMGTTYFVDQGFMSQIMTDLKGFETVGRTLYGSGRERIYSWLAQRDEPVHICGTSLGGSLALLLAMDAPKNYHLSRVDALNPAGIHDAKSRSQFDKWHEPGKKPLVVVQKGGNDVVSLFGKWKPGWKVLKVSPPTAKKGPNGFWDHALNYAGLKGARITEVDIAVDNEERKVRNLLLYTWGRACIYYLFLMPYFYIARPVLNFVFDHWLKILLLAATCLAVYFSVIGMVAGFFVAATVAFCAAMVVVIDYINDVSTEEVSSQCKKAGLAAVHDPMLPRNKSMDIYHEDNKVYFEMTYGEVHTYYTIMRCMVQEKAFIPEPVNARAEEKIALLKTSQLIAKKEDKVSLCVTPAKAAHIKYTLFFNNHFARATQKDELTQAIRDQYYNQYKSGKV